MTYRRFELPEKAKPVATVATTATRPGDGQQSVATVAMVPDHNIAFDERAAIVEFEAGVPRDWAERFARLDAARPIAGLTTVRWRQLIDDGGRFIDRWAQEVARLGWSAEDVFGVHPTAPAARLDGMGLVALIGGGEVVAVNSERATIRARSGNCLTYYLRRPRPEAVAIWNLDV